MTETSTPAQIAPSPGQSACLYPTAQVDWQVRSKHGVVLSSEKLPCQPGDSLWVRETWASVNDLMHNLDDIIYRADGNAGWKHGWRPSIHMPRWASRITLEVTDVRVERLQDISKADALAEGALEAVEVGYIGSMTCDQARQAFAELWDDLHKHRPGLSWDDNPWVAAIQSRVAQP